MKKYILLLFVLSITGIFNAYSQQPKAKWVESKDAKIAQQLAPLDTIVRYNNRFISMNIYKSVNGPVSTRTTGTGEVNYQILLVVSHGDGASGQRLYKLGDFYNPNSMRIFTLPSGVILFNFEHGIAGKRQILSAQVALTGIFVHETIKK